MGLYRVREGQRIGHAGREYGPGEMLEIPDHVAAEGNVRERVEALDAQGNVVDHASLAAELATARPHERLTLLAREVELRRASLREAEDRLAAERAMARAESEDNE